MKMFFMVSLSRSMCVLVCLSCCVRPNLSSVPSEFDFIQIEGETFSECSRWNDDALSCFTFNLSPVNREISAAILLFNKKKHINANPSELVLFDLGPLNGFEERIGEKRVISREAIRTRAKLVKIDLTDVVKSWTTSCAETRIMAFKYSNCEYVFGVEDGKRPSIGVIYSEAQLSRRQVIASGNCDTGNSCCLVHQNITFDHLGWHSVFYPLTMNIGRCRGVCRIEDYSTAPMTNNSYLWARHLFNLPASSRASAGAPICCAPAAFHGPASIMYFSTAGRMEVSHLESVKVARCGCL